MQEQHDDRARATSEHSPCSTPYWKRQGERKEKWGQNFDGSGFGKAGFGCYSMKAKNNLWIKFCSHRCLDQARTFTNF
jgi:hypothetical protein